MRRGSAHGSACRRPPRSRREDGGAGQSPDHERSRITGVNDCLICERVALAREAQNPYLIAEMEHTYFVVGDHQCFKGYALVLLKEHVREPFELPPDVQREHLLK